MKASAVLSACGKYRYELHRVWDRSKAAVLFIGLNPSTADAQIEDNTSRVCIGYAKKWGYGSLLIGNLFAFRSTDPQALKVAIDPVGPMNDKHLKRLHSLAALTVCAWGNPGAFRGRDKTVLNLIANPHCLVQLRSGRPGHPLYKSSALRPQVLANAL